MGAVIPSNQNCYLLRVEDGVKGLGAHAVPRAQAAKVSGAARQDHRRRSCMGRLPPTLTPNLVLSPTNQTPVNLLMRRYEDRRGGGR